MALFDTTGFHLMEEGIDILTRSQSLIGHNLTNQDTPNYKCKYMSFSGVLQDKLNASENAKYKKELHLSSYIYTDKNTYDQPDGNNVDSDTQMALFEKQGLLIKALESQLNSEFTLMRSAMKRT